MPSSISDPLLTPAPGTLRVSYATGRMLNTEDFEAEQLYHRGRLAHALASLYVTGTVSGLNVTEQTTGDGVKELLISAGIAIDRSGRIVDVRAPLCIRLQAWLDAQTQSDLSDAFKTVDSTIVADIFLGFQQTTQGKTPSFAAGDYDATDAYSANRWQDSFSAQLLLRPEATPPLPADPWTAAFPNPGTTTLDTVKTAILSGQSGAAAPPVEYPVGADATSVFLARIRVPATRANAGDRPAYDLSNPVNIDNTSRLFIYPGALFARWFIHQQAAPNP